jgi:hypothetical protein
MKSLPNSTTIPAVTRAASSAGAAMSRWNAVEAEAERVYQGEAGKAIARAVFGKDGSHHVFLKTGATTLEIKNGEVAVAVAATD